jgi:hypothetical protein
MANPIQPTYSDKIPPDILLRTFLSKGASRFVISLINAQDSAPQVATGLTNALHIFIVSTAHIFGKVIM